MTDKNKTEIVVIMDKSGSMATLQNDVIGGFNSLVEDQKRQPGDASLTLATFDSVTDFVYLCRPIGDVEPLCACTYRPGGSTALLDAICTTIDAVGGRLAKLPEYERPGKVLVVIMTDGEENSSIFHRLADVRTRIEHQKTKYSWDFVYLGANQDTFHEAGNLGINISYDWLSDSTGTKEAYTSTSGMISAYRNGNQNWQDSYTSAEVVVGAVENVTSNGFTIGSPVLVAPQPPPVDPQ